MVISIYFGQRSGEGDSASVTDGTKVYLHDAVVIRVVQHFTGGTTEEQIL